MPSSVPSAADALVNLRWRKPRPARPMIQSVAMLKFTAARNGSTAMPGCDHATTMIARGRVSSRAETKPPRMKQIALVLCPTAPMPRPRSAARAGEAVALCMRRRMERDASALRLDLTLSRPIRKNTIPASTAGSVSAAVIVGPALNRSWRWGARASWDRESNGAAAVPRVRALWFTDLYMKVWFGSALCFFDARREHDLRRFGRRGARGGRGAVAWRAGGGEGCCGRGPGANELCARGTGASGLRP